jgi:AcrR family transcriptional regulator
MAAQRSAARATAGLADARVVVPEGVAPPDSVPADVFAAAVDSWVSGQRLDMQALARKLGVGRATLYRRAGNREQLLDEVLWWRGRHALVDAVQRTARRRGVPRLVALINLLLDGIQRDRPLREFLEADPETALRTLTGTRSTVQRGMTGALERAIDLEIERGHFDPDLDTPTLAYAITRITEGFLYSDIIADRKVDIERGTAVVEALLRGLDRRRPN